MIYFNTFLIYFTILTIKKICNLLNDLFGLVIILSLYSLYYFMAAFYFALLCDSNKYFNF
jgi:hypothetical protein